MTHVAALDLDVSVPLVVDLDGTLILTDSLYEAYAKLLFSDPVAALTSLPVIRRGRATFKRHVTGMCQLAPRMLPVRSELVDLIRREKARGRAVHLVTAADQALADSIAAEWALFDTVKGSDGKRNLKGPEKLDYLQERFSDGFIYAGDHRADLSLFNAARGAILCDVDRRTRREAAHGPARVMAELQSKAATLGTWLRLLRVHQWSKNGMVFVPLITAHAYGDPLQVAKTALACLLLCALASATYMINDIADLEADRLHPVKRRRPFASGRIPIVFGLVAAPLIIAGTLIGAYFLSPAFLLGLLGYLLLTTVYSFGLKRVPLLDVFAIAILFTLRIVMGTEVLDVGYSPWLLSFSMAFFLSLALAKRHGEIMRARQAQVSDIRGRGYASEDWPITLTFGIGVGLVSVVIMLLYMTNDASPSGFYLRQAWLYAIPALVTLWLMRIWMLSHRMLLDDDPVVFAVKDPVSLGLGVLAVAAFALAL